MGRWRARLQRPFHRAQADQRQGAGGATDHGVELVQPRRQLGQAHHLGAEARGQRLATVQRAVGNGHAARLAGSEMGGGQLYHLAGADEQHPDVGQVFKQLAGQSHRGGSHADRVRADLGAGAHLLGDRERTLEQLVQRAAQGAGLFGHAHGILHLPQDLRLAQHHGIQPAGDAESVAGRLVVVQRIGVAAQLLGGDAAAVRQPVHHGLQLQLLAGAIDFGAVAGRDDGRLGAARQRASQPLQGGLQLVQRKRKTGPADRAVPSCG